jgi:hypothetical protein
MTTLPRQQEGHKKENGNQCMQDFKKNVWG